MSAGQDKLVRMVNQIATEFENQDPANAAKATWDHLWHFWDPRMRGYIIHHLDGGGAGLCETGRQAIALLRDRGEAPSQTPATEFAGTGGRTSPSDAG